LKELTVISGKGGTGKTSIVAAFAALAKNKVLADCDVDAADLFLIAEPKINYSEDFIGSKVAEIDQELCVDCGICQELCRFDAINTLERNGGVSYHIDSVACEGCGVCDWFCPEEAISLKEKVNGRLFISGTRFGPMVYAKLGIAEENSGKLVTLVRTHSKRICSDEECELIINDGSPGIGCPVIASITGASLVLAVTEPTLSGQHDLKRVLDLANHFHIPAVVCINKWDLNEELSDKIEQQVVDLNGRVVGRVRYDEAVTRAMIDCKSVVEYTDNGASEDIVALWRRVGSELGLNE